MENTNLVIVKSEDFGGVVCDFWRNENNEIFMTSSQLGTALEYTDPRRAINKIVRRNNYLDDVEFSSVVNLVTPYGTQETRIFSEDGIYEIIMLSKTSKSLEFKKWVRSILKGLRKGELVLLKEKAYNYDLLMSAGNSLTMMEVAKSIKLCGRNSLLKFLRDEKILMSNASRKNIPYQQYIDQGYFNVVIKNILVNGQIVDIPVCLVTPKGIDFIIKRLRKKDLLPNPLLSSLKQIS